MSENPDLKGFDHIAVGGAIRGGQVSSELQNYLKENQPWLSGKVRSLFTVCGNRRQPVGPEPIARFIDNHPAPLCGA